MTIAVLLAALGIPAAAQSKPSFGMRTYTVQVSDATLRLDFHGDVEAGCADLGVCSTSGTATSTTSRRGEGRGDIFSLNRQFSGSMSAFVDGATISRVQALGAPDCTDMVVRRADNFIMLADRAGPLTFGYGTQLETHTEDGGQTATVDAGSARTDDPFASRCAGPSTDDVTSALPRVELPRTALLQKTIRVTLSGSRRFSSGGFAGTVTSEMQFTLRRRPCSGKRQRSDCRAFDRMAKR